MSATARRAARRRLPLGPGWLPAGLVVLLAVACLARVARVEVLDTLGFLAYAGLWLTLPGTLAWRFVHRGREPRHIGEDLVLGTLVGCLLEFPAYVVCLALGVPGLYTGWPLVALAATLPFRSGRRLWRPSGLRHPAARSWTTAAVVGAVVVWVTRNAWAPLPMTPRGLRYSHVDEPYHLSLAAGLRHWFPPQAPYVAGTPLKYHWLSHLHVAAASVVTGLEPILVLRDLAVPVLIVLVAYATVLVVQRLTGAFWTGPVAVVAFTVQPVDFSGWGDGAAEPLLSNRLVASPSSGFVLTALLVGLLLVVDLIRHRLSGWPVWVVVVLDFVAIGGAKSTTLPTVVAGLVAAALVGLVVRRPDRTVLALAGTSVVAFTVAKIAFVGAGSHGTYVQPLRMVAGESRVWTQLQVGPDQVSPGVAVLLALPYLGLLTLGAGLLALLLRRGWRDPVHVFLVVTFFSGLGAALLLHQSSFSEYYFLYGVYPPLAIGATLGLHGLVTRLPRRLAIGVGVVATGVGAAATLGFGALTRSTDPHSDLGGAVATAVHVFVLPLVVLVAVAVVLVALVSLLAWSLLHRSGGDRAQRGTATALVAVLVLAGMGLGPALRGLPRLVSDPIPTSSPQSHPFIGPGGVAAARWLRAHSSPDDLVATNAHCDQPPPWMCVPRAFWIAGYTERRVLVEGWSYISRATVGLPSPKDENTVVQPFWDQRKLADNDAAFTAPSPATLGRLRDRYGVRWLVVDRRFPHDEAGLRREARVAFSFGQYLVLRLP